MHTCILKAPLIIPFEKNFQKTIVEKICDKINNIALCGKLFFESHFFAKTEILHQCFSELRLLFNEENSLQEKYFKVKKVLEKYNISMKDIYFIGRFLRKVILLLV
jgi:hypothetical protein